MSKKDNQHEDLDKNQTTETKIAEKRPTCGIIMPISGNDDCSADHWMEVLDVLKEVGEAAGFKTNLVSIADDTNVIQRTIVQNVFASDIIICDVSCKNANVMFELGMRLAFDKATVIIKDESTGYSFDTGIVEHLEYPRGLRLGKMLKFKDQLFAKLQSTHKKSIAQDYSMFLHNFGTFKIAKLHETEMTPNEYMMAGLKHLQQSVDLLGAKVTLSSQAEHREYRKSSPARDSSPDYNEAKSLIFHKISDLILADPTAFDSHSKRREFINSFSGDDRLFSFTKSRLYSKQLIQDVFDEAFSV